VTCVSNTLSEPSSNRSIGIAMAVVTAMDPEAPDAVLATDLETMKEENTRVLVKFQHKVERFFALADIVVLPSTYREGVPTVLLEGMAMGVPVVTTNRPGCREAVLHGRNGYLFDAGSSSQLVDRLADLVDDEAKRREFGRVGVELARKRFSDDTVNARVRRELYLMPATGRSDGPGS